MRRWVLPLLVVALLVGSRIVETRLLELREQGGLTDLSLGAELTPAEFLASRLAGPLRAVPVPILWTEAMDAFKRQDWHRALAVYRTLSILTPRDPEVWMLQGWNMAVNIAQDSYEKGMPDRAFEWLEEGLDHLAEGARRNPSVPEIHYYRGLLLARSVDPLGRSREMVEYYRTRFETEGRDPLQEAIPCFDRAAELADEKGIPDFRIPDQAWRARHRLALLREAAGDPEEAVKLLVGAIPWADKALEIVDRYLEQPWQEPEYEAALRAFRTNLAGRRDLLQEDARRIQENMERLEPHISR
jgi:hypothetical protein